MTNPPQAQSKPPVHSHTQECRNSRDGIRQTIRGVLGIKVLAEKVENTPIGEDSQRHLFLSVVAPSSVEPQEAVSRQEKLDGEGWAVCTYILRGQVRPDVRAIQIPALLSTALSRGRCRRGHSRLHTQHPDHYSRDSQDVGTPNPQFPTLFYGLPDEDREHRPGQSINS
jgi:hypothetical protein